MKMMDAINTAKKTVVAAAFVADDLAAGQKRRRVEIDGVHMTADCYCGDVVKELDDIGDVICCLAAGLRPSAVGCFVTIIQQI